MNSKVKLIALVIVAVVIVCVGILLGRSGKPDKATNPPNRVVETTASVTPTDPVTPLPVPDAVVASASNPVPAIPIPVEVAGTNSAASTNLIANWEEKVEEILKLDIEDKDIAKQLIAIFPRLPTDGQIDVVQHISNLLPDENYSEVAKLMNDAKLPEDVLNQLFMDLLNRKTTVLLPELIELAKNPEHPTAGEAKDFLELYLEQDYGTDWNLWQAKVKEYLTANPD
jgi:hypothetical protein